MKLVTLDIDIQDSHVYYAMRVEGDPTYEVDLSTDNERVTVNEVTDAATRLLHENNYEFLENSPGWQWNGKMFHAEVQRKDTTLDYTIGGTELRHIQDGEELAHLLNSDTYILGHALSGGWRVQFGYDEDNDQTLLVHNGQRWIAAWRADKSARWKPHVGVPRSLSQTPIVDVSQWLHDIETRAKEGT